MKASDELKCTIMMALMWFLVRPYSSLRASMTSMKSLSSSSTSPSSWRRWTWKSMSVSNCRRGRPTCSERGGLDERRPGEHGHPRQRREVVLSLNAPNMSLTTSVSSGIRLFRPSSRKNLADTERHMTSLVYALSSALRSSASPAAAAPRALATARRTSASRAPRKDRTFLAVRRCVVSSLLAWRHRSP
jgi:hypothetical protein